MTMPEQTPQSDITPLSTPKKKRRAKPFRFKVEYKDGLPAIGVEEANAEQMFETTGQAVPMAGHYLLFQVLDATPTRFRGNTMKENVEALNRLAQMMHSIAPKDGVEGMLTAQMVTCNNMALECMRLAMVKGESPEKSQQYLKQAEKFMRTFTSQVEALTKYRTRGQQTIQVQHVQVNQGGQAIVGNIHS